jgi:hypothetical protein
MNTVLKDKKYKVYSLIAIITTMMFTGIFIQCCSDNSDIDELKVSETISSSIEFENYLIAYFTFTNECVTIQNSPQIIGQINGKKIWKKTVNKIDRKLLDDVVESNKILVNKFPEYPQMNDTKKHELLNNALIKSEKIRRLIPVNNLSPTIRLKQGSEIPSVPGFFLDWFASITEAYQACMNYSQTNNVESGGYIFPDGRAILIIDSLATDSTMRIPVWNNGASAGFHYHPGNNPSMSPQDSLAMSLMQEHGIDSLIIITQDTISGYGF